MTLTPSQRWGLIGGVGGGVIGGLTWVVVAGAVIGDARIWVSALIVAPLLWWGGVRLALGMPGRHLTAIGLVILAVVVLDWIYCGIVFPRLPPPPPNIRIRGAPLWDLSQGSFIMVRGLLIGAAIVAMLLIAYDQVILKRREP